MVSVPTSNSVFRYFYVHTYIYEQLHVFAATRVDIYASREDFRLLGSHFASLCIQRLCRCGDWDTTVGDVMRYLRENDTWAWPRKRRRTNEEEQVEENARKWFIIFEKGFPFSPFLSQLWPHVCSELLFSFRFNVPHTRPTRVLLFSLHSLASTNPLRKYLNGNFFITQTKIQLALPKLKQNNEFSSAANTIISVSCLSKFRFLLLLRGTIERRLVCDLCDFVFDHKTMSAIGMPAIRTGANQAFSREKKLVFSTCRMFFCCSVPPLIPWQSSQPFLCNSFTLASIELTRLFICSPFVTR